MTTIDGNLILLVTNKYDVTSDFVVAALRRRRASFVRLNTEDFISHWNMQWRISDVVMRSDRVVFRQSDIKSVYYRRPKSPTPAAGTSPDAATFVMSEGRSLLRNFLANTDATWISPIACTERAENKLLQLRTAYDLGFSTPRTLVTNDYEVADAFLTECKEAVVKPISDGWLRDEPPGVAFTTAITDGMRASLRDSISTVPHLLQERVRKHFDVRVTVVGDRVFACRIHSQTHNETRTDFRMASISGIRLRHEIVTLPKDVAGKCADLVRLLGLRFGAIDMIESADGYIFLEINPNGQWAWIEQLTGAPISDAISELLNGSTASGVEG